MSAQAADRFANVDPELRGGLDFYLSLAPESDAPVGLDQVPLIRSRFGSLAKPPVAAPAFQERAIPGPAGAPDVPVIVINADPNASKPAILHIHGGGFISGSAASGLADLQIEAKALDCVIVTVEYRLAPETPHPGALDDNYAALLWLDRNAAELGVDRSRIAIQGESAGAGHAAMLALRARDRGEVRICFQSLTYPMLDDRTATSRVVPEHIGRFLWTRQLNALGWRALLGDDPGGEHAPLEAVPARAADLSGLPPTFISVGDIDLFVEEDVAFAGRLISAGVPTELLVLPGAFHGFYVLSPDAGVSRRHTLAHINALARALGRPELAKPPAAAPWAPSSGY